MKHILRTAHLIVGACLLSSLELKAEDKGPEAQPKHLGLWEAIGDQMYLEFVAKGKMHMINAHELPMSGTWEKKEGKNQLQVNLKRGGETFDALMELKFDGDDKVTITVEGEPQSFTRVKGDLDGEKLLGIWLSSEKDEEMNTTTHYVLTRKKDGTLDALVMEAMDKKKIYCISKEKYLWRVVGDRLLETYEPGTEDENITIYSGFKFEEDKMHYTIHGEDDVTFDDVRLKEAKLPDPPKGYKKVTPDEYWEIYDKELEKLEGEELPPIIEG